VSEEKKLDLILEKLSVFDERFDKIEARLDRIEERVNEVESNFQTQIDKLRDDVRYWIEGLYRHVSQESDKTNQRIDQVDRKVDKISKDVEYLSSKSLEHDKELYHLKRKMG